MNISANLLYIVAATNLLAALFTEYDIRVNNAQTPSLMRWVWRLTVLYSGLIGLAVYWFSGRRQISRDTVWRRGWRSVAHCYAGCGIGEIAGVIISVGLLSLGNWGVALWSFSLAYVMGFALTVGPLMQDGVPFKTAVRDSFLAETISITVMEVTAISLDIWLAGGTGLTSPQFWFALVVSLSAGLFAAWPINVLLIHFGIKEGMHDPRHMAHDH
ncbi:MAG: DUF4396 domain-containing protein [Gammaproteobacteria bacterium]|nr:DUF4396 domain-containing protein [Gammaproteobacteria bacterium]